jgi:glycosyltransferase involved in cell wall biosynthesis
MPIDWPEPFGLVMIEAFACGTPVIAYRHGSVPEIVTDGVTGFVVDNQEQAVQAVARLAGLDRQRCRQAFLQRFTARHMAQAYLRLYEALRKQALQKRAAPPSRSALAARAAAMYQEHHG